MNMEDQETLTVKNIKHILNIGTNNAYALVHSGVFPVVKVGHSYRIPKDAFYEWMNHHTANAATLLCKPSY